MSNIPRTLALAAWGDPMATSTWSGTPANLAVVWRAQGIELVGLNCRPERAALLAAHALDKARGMDLGFTRRRLGRAACVRLCASLPASCAGVLHMSSVTVPPADATPGVRHFLLCDSMNDYWARYGVESKAQSPRQRAAAEVAEREAVASLSLGFPISEHAAQSLRQHYGMDSAKITVVGTGRGGIRPLSGAKSRRSKQVLMVAKQRFEDKGGPLLIEAIRLARASDPEISLTLVSPTEFEHFARGIEGVQVTGTLPWDELQRLFDEAPLYAMPAPCEPWGLVYAEALATRTPILGLNRAALPELTGGGRYGFLVEDETPDAVARALVGALGDPERLARMGEEGQAFCLEHFSWERTAELINDAIWG